MHFLRGMTVVLTINSKMKIIICGFFLKHYKYIYYLNSEHTVQNAIRSINIFIFTNIDLPSTTKFHKLECLKHNLL